MTDSPSSAADATGKDAPRLPRVPQPFRWLTLALWLAAVAAVIAVNLAGLWLGFEATTPLELLGQSGTGLAAATALLAAAILPVRRDPGDSVGLLLSFSFLAAAAYVGPAGILFAMLELESLGNILPSLWVGLLVAALPAFPDGRYDPRWGRFLTWAALPYTILISADTVAGNDFVILATTIIGFGVVLIALTAAIMRFRRTPPGLERQQLKWASLGLGACIVLLIASVALAYLVEGEAFPEDSLGWVMILYYALHDFAFALLGIGLLVALLRLRLWDADRAIGRSLAYFLLTLILACVWAVSSTLVNDFVSSQVGGGNKGLSAALSTIVAALVFGPARERVNTFVEKRLQRGILQLRKLPNRLAVWQSLDDPALFGSRIAATVADSLHAGHTAVLLFEGEAFQVLAAENIGQAEVESWIAARGSFSDLEWEARDDALFPLRLILTDEDVLIGALLVGRRSDGSFYPREERSTLFDLEPPLAAALHRVQQRTVANRAVGCAIAELDERIGRVEARVPPRA